MEAKKKDKREWEWELAFFGWNGSIVAKQRGD